MDNRLPTFLRAIVCVVGAALVVVAIALPADAMPLRLLLATLGVVLFIWGVNGTTLEEVSLVKGGAKFRQRTLDAIREQAPSVFPDPKDTPPPEPGAQTPQPSAEPRELPPTDVRRTAEDDLSFSDEVSAQVTTWEELRNQVAHAATPKQFASFILLAIRAAQSRRPRPEYWADHRHVGGEDRVYHFGFDLRDLPAEQSFKVSEQAMRIVDQTSTVTPGVASVFAVIAEAARTWAQSLPFGGPPNVLRVIVGASGEDDRGRALNDRQRAEAIAREHALDPDPVVATFWQALSDTLASDELLDSG